MRQLLYSSALLLAATTAAHAQDVNVMDTITQGFQTSAQGWEAPLQNLALSTFGSLALIQWGWAMIRLALRQPDFSEVCAELVQQIIYIGLFFWMLTTWATWGPLIIASLRQAAGIAGGLTILTPGDVFHIGIDMASAVWQQVMTFTGLTHPGQSIGLALAAFLILGAMPWICATMILALVQGYFLASTAVLFMAFGGNSFTREIALAGVRQVFAVGAKLFALQLVVTVGIGMMRTWVPTSQTFDVNQVMVMIGEALVLAVVCKSVPDMAERMLGGVGFAHGGAIFGTAARAAATAVGAAGVGVGLISGVVGAGAMVGGAADLAGAQVAARIAAGNVPRSRAIAMLGATAKNTGAAVASNIGARLSGQRGGFAAGLYREAARSEQTAARQRQANTPPPAPPPIQPGANP
jgi:type IV secretion system protein TrbL